MTPFFRPGALRAYRLFESFDLDETRERISAVMQPHALIPNGRTAGRSRMDFIKIGGLGLGSIAFGDAMRVEVEAIDGYYLLMFCVSGEAQVDTLGRTIRVDRENGILCPPGQGFGASLSPDCEQFVLRIDPAALAAQTGWTSPSLPHGIALASPPLSGWLQQLQLVTSSPELLVCASENPGVARQLELLLLELLAVGHEGTVSLARHGAPSPGFVKRAEEFITEHRAERLQLEDISRAVGVAARTLRDGFQQFKGASPMQYLHAVRLERAQQVLRSTPTGVRIADVALDCGFTHLGRFSISYKERFGESPSETLRKSRAS